MQMADFFAVNAPAAKEMWDETVQSQCYWPYEQVWRQELVSYGKPTGDSDLTRGV